MNAPEPCGSSAQKTRRLRVDYRRVDYGVFTGLKRFLLEPTPTPAQAAAPLRTLFALAFLGQFGVVALAGVGLALVATPVSAGNPLVAQMLLAVALLELPVAFWVAEMVARPGGKEGAMAGAIALGVVLATPVWLALFAWLSGSAALYLLLFAGLILLFYTFGVLLAPRYARRLEPEVSPKGAASPGADAPETALPAAPTDTGADTNTKN